MGNKLSDQIKALTAFGPNVLVCDITLGDWQQRAEYLETSLAQWQGEEYDLDEPLFVTQLDANELNMLVEFIGTASRVQTMQRITSAETWKMLDEKLNLLIIQINKFNQQKLAALANNTGEDHANT